MSLILFQHIPKCGGTSIGEAIKHQFPSALCSDAPYLGAIEEEVKFSGKRQVYSAHIRHAEIFQSELFTSQPLILVTMLRDPIARVISQWKNFSDPDGHQQHWPSKESARNMIGSSLITFLSQEKGAALDHVDNVMTRNLVSARSWKAKGERDFYSEEMVNEAMDNLEKRYSAWGILEQLQQSALRISKALSVCPLENISNKNARPKSYSLSKAELGLIQSRNRMDIELYSRAVELFNMQAPLDQEDVVRSALASIPKGQKSFHVASPIFSSDWDYIEEHPAGSYRWSKKKRARVFLPKVDATHQIALTLIGHLEGIDIDGVEVDGALWERVSSEILTNDGHIKTRLVFGPPSCDVASARLDFMSLNVLSRVSEYGAGENCRALGVPLIQIDCLQHFA